MQHHLLWIQNRFAFIKKPNKPALIQLQIIQENLFSYIILIEVCHLPHPDEHTFKLIQRLFEYLFESNQIYLSNNINLQNRFKNYWHEHHPHQSTLLSTNNDTKVLHTYKLKMQQH
ncbi:unnamed protein product, partial [Adineta steineri]